MKSFIGILSYAAVVGFTLSFSGFRPGSAAEIGKGVDFYLLEDEKMSFEKARDLPLNELKLQAAPWIASDNIDRYDWSCHFVYLKQPVDIPNEKGAKYVNLHGKPFVVVAQGTRCYLGALWSMVSSYLPPGSVAKVDVWGEKIERFQINLFSFLPKSETQKEMRDNPVLKETLRLNGQLHAGLECKLDKVEAERNDRDFSLVYTYTIFNKDQDGLYVLDPEKFHPAIFHDFNNGLAIQNMDNEEYIRWPNPRTGEPAHVLNPELSWYTLLHKGESMTRTVAMKLTPRLPPESGKYKFIFTYVGYGYGFLHDNIRSGNNNQLLLKDYKIATDPKAADGRLWLGQISAELRQNVK
jgi:hypothetical protein